MRTCHLRLEILIKLSPHKGCRTQPLNRKCEAIQNLSAGNVRPYAVYVDIEAQVNFLFIFLVRNVNYIFQKLAFSYYLFVKPIKLEFAGTEQKPC